MQHTLSKTSLVTLALTVLGPLLFAHTLRAGDLAPMLQPILADSKLPSIAAAVVIGDKIEDTGAVGVRKSGEPTPVTVDDKYHLGSCTKTMTAALTAMLVKEGLLTWQTTIGEVLKGGVRKEFKNVTIEQLLAHVGGFAGECPPEIWAQAYADQGKLSPARQRQKFVKALLDRKPDYVPGTKSVYSNQGYAVAGVMLETLARKPWEDLMREKIFKPLVHDERRIPRAKTGSALGAQGRHASRSGAAWRQSGRHRPGSHGPCIHRGLGEICALLPAEQG